MNTEDLMVYMFRKGQEQAQIDLEKDAPLPTSMFVKFVKPDSAIVWTECRWKNGQMVHGTDCEHFDED